MADQIRDPEAWLAGAHVAESVWALRPDYVAGLVTATGLTPGPSDAHSDAVLVQAEREARDLLGDGLPEALPHMVAWREAFRAFGAKPQRTRNSAEALLRRVPEGLPRINRLADLYNALSIGTATPLGGEDLSAYAGPLTLTRATGDEEFLVLASGEPVNDPPAPGEVVWRDDAGVTCRRWNWRQCARTALTERTTDAIFIVDVLDVTPGDAAGRAAQVLDRLTGLLAAGNPGVRLNSRVLSAPAGHG